MRRRELILGLAGVIAAPLFARAQQRALPLIGILSDEPPDLAADTLRSLVQGLRDRGIVEGQNITLLSRYGKTEDLPNLAADLVRLQPNVIVAVGTPATRAAQANTQTIPIVFARIADPIGLGLVSSLARPTGNLTGVSLLATDVATKWLELLVAMVSDANRIGILWDPSFAPSGPQYEDIRGAARSLKLELVTAGARRADEFETGVRVLREKGAIAAIALPCPLFASNALPLANLMAQARLPAMFGRREQVEAGGLMSYGTNYAETYRRAAAIVAKILTGTKPADIPVEQPTKLELVVNLKTAKALGLTVPPSILARADEVIE